MGCEGERRDPGPACLLQFCQSPGESDGHQRLQRCQRIRGRREIGGAGGAQAVLKVETSHKLPLSGSIQSSKPILQSSCFPFALCLPSEDDLSRFRFSTLLRRLELAQPWGSWQSLFSTNSYLLCRFSRVKETASPIGRHQLSGLGATAFTKTADLGVLATVV